MNFRGGLCNFPKRKLWKRKWESKWQKRGLTVKGPTWRQANPSQSTHHLSRSRLTTSISLPITPSLSLPFSLSPQFHSSSARERDSPRRYVPNLASKLLGLGFCFRSLVLKLVVCSFLLFLCRSEIVDCLVYWSVVRITIDVWIDHISYIIYS